VTTNTYAEYNMTPVNHSLCGYDFIVNNSGYPYVTNYTVYTTLNNSFVNMTVNGNNTNATKNYTITVPASSVRYFNLSLNINTISLVNLSSLNFTTNITRVN